MADFDFTPMAVGEQRSVDVAAAAKWNRTGIMIEPGRYAFAASGLWWDLIVPAGPDGYDTSLFGPFAHKRRVPWADWFTLMGSLDEDPAGAVAIGRTSEHSFTKAGELVCFANDLDAMYWNNWGHLKLTVTRRK